MELINFSLLILLRKKLKPRESEWLFSYLNSLAEWEPDLKSPTCIIVFISLQREPEDPTVITIYRAFHVHLVPTITLWGVTTVILILENLRDFVTLLVIQSKAL